MRKPTFWIVAGPNGAGKTTLVQSSPISALLADVEFVNPDDISLQRLREKGYANWADVPENILRETFISAANEVSERIEAALKQGRSIGVETVLSTEKYRPIIESVLKDQGSVGLIYVALASPAISQARVHDRVKQGGHGVPADKITARWQRSLDGLNWYLRAVSAFWIVDNSNWDPTLPPRYLAVGQDAELIDYDESATFPELRHILSQLPHRTDETCS